MSLKEKKGGQKDRSNGNEVGTGSRPAPFTREKYAKKNIHGTMEKGANVSVLPYYFGEGVAANRKGSL